MRANVGRRRHVGDRGFTLIEVLVAMVILAIGLLGLQALGIGTARAIALGQIQTEYAIAASAVLEEATREVSARPGDFAEETVTREEESVECGERECRIVTVIEPTELNDPACRDGVLWRTMRYDVAVEVQPTADQNLPWGSIDYDVASELFIPFQDGNC